MTTKFDRLVAAKAVAKEIQKRVKTLEDDCKEEFLENYRLDGTDRVRSTVFDKKAAYMDLRGGKPSCKETRFQVNDPDEVLDWIDEQGLETSMYRFMVANIGEFAEWYFHDTGECPEGCSVITYDTEPKEPTPYLTVKEASIIAALNENPNLLSETKTLLLGDGGE